MTAFALTWDYRCPFARNGAEHVLEAVADGMPIEVTWLAFSLSQVHVEEGGVDVWDDPGSMPALRAMLAGVTVRDRLPEQFPAVHHTLSRARHDEGLDIRDQTVVDGVLGACGVDPAEVRAHIEEGWPIEVLRDEHQRGVKEHQVFGVPTFIVGDQAAFVRLMHRPRGDAALATRTVERVLDLVAGWSDLNELKHTSIPR